MAVNDSSLYNMAVQIDLKLKSHESLVTTDKKSVTTR